LGTLKFRALAAKYNFYFVIRPLYYKISRCSIQGCLGYLARKILPNNCFVVRYCSRHRYGPNTQQLNCQLMPLSTQHLLESCVRWVNPRELRVPAFAGRGPTELCARLLSGHGLNLVRGSRGIKINCAGNCI